MPRAELNVIATVQDQATSQLQRLRGEVWMLSRVAERGAAGITRYDVAMSGLMAGGMLTAFALGVDALAKAGVTFNSEILKVINNTTVLQKYVGQADYVVERLGSSILKMSAQFGAASDQVAAGWMHAYNMVSDLDIADIITQIGTKSAVANFANVEETVNILANTMHAYALDVSYAASQQARLSQIQYNALVVMGQMDRAAAAGNMTVEQFNKAAGRSIAIGANLRVPLEQVAAAFVALTKHGYSAAQAQTQVSNLLQRLANPTAAALKNIKALSKASGVDLVRVFTAQYLAQHGLAGALAEINRAYRAMGYTAAEATQESYKLINAQRGGQALAVLLGTGLNDYNAALKMLSDREAMAAVNEEQFQEVTERTGWQLGKAEITVNAIATALGDGMGPAIVAVFKPINALLDSVFNWVQANKVLAGTITAVVGVVAGLLGVFMTIGGTIMLLTPIIKSAGAAWGYLTGQLSGFSRENDVATASAGRASVPLRAGATAAAVLGGALSTVTVATGALGRLLGGVGRVAGVEFAKLGTAVGVFGRAQGLAIRDGAKLLNTLGNLIWSMNLSTQAVKGQTQAQLDLTAATRAGEAARDAQATTTSLATAALREQGIVAGITAKAEYTFAASVAEATRGNKLYELAMKLGARAGEYLAQSAEAQARAIALANVSDRESLVLAKASTTAKRLQEAANRSNAAALGLVAAETDRTLTAEARQIVLEKALVDQTKARQKAMTALNAVNAAVKKANEAVVVAEAAMRGTLAGTTEGVTAYSRAQAVANELKQMAVSINGVLAGINRDLAVTETALAAATVRETRASTASLVVGRALNMTLAGLSIAMLAASRGMVVLNFVLARLSVVARLAGVAIGIVRSVVATLIGAAAAAAKSVFNLVRAFVASQVAARQAARADQELALAMERTAVAATSAGMAAGKSAGLFGLLGAAVNKLLGPLLTLLILGPLIADAYSSNFLGIKSIIDSIFGTKTPEPPVDTSKMTKKQLVAYQKAQKEHEELVKKQAAVEKKADDEAAKNPLGAFAINRAWEKVKKTIDSVIQPGSPIRGVWDWIKVAGDTVIPLVISGVESLGKAFATARNLVSGFFKILEPVFNSVFSAISTIFGTYLPIIGEYLGSAGNTGAAFAKDFHKLPPAIQPVVKLLGELFVTGYRVANWIRVFGELISSGFSTGFAYSKDFWMLPEGLREIAKFAGSAAVWLGQFFTTLRVGAEYLTSAVTTGFAFSKDLHKVPKNLQPIVKILGTLGGIVFKVSSAFGDLLSGKTDIWGFFQRIFGTIQGKAPAISAEFAKLVGKIDWDGVWTAATNAAVAAVGGVEGLLNKAWGLLFGREELVPTDKQSEKVKVWVDGLIQKVPWDKVWQTFNTVAGKAFAITIDAVGTMTGWIAKQFSNISWSDVWDQVKVVGNWAAGLWDKLFSPGTKVEKRRMGGTVLDAESLVTIDEGIGHKLLVWIQSIWPTEAQWQNEIWPKVSGAAQSAFNWTVDVAGKLTNWAGDQLSKIDWKAALKGMGELVSNIWDLLFAPGEEKQSGRLNPFRFGEPEVEVEGRGVIPTILKKLDEMLWQLANEIQSDQNALPGAKGAGAALGKALDDAITGFTNPDPNQQSGLSRMAAIGGKMAEQFVTGFIDYLLKAETLGKIRGAIQAALIALSLDLMNRWFGVDYLAEIAVRNMFPADQDLVSKIAAEQRRARSTSGNAPAINLDSIAASAKTAASGIAKDVSGVFTKEVGQQIGLANFPELTLQSKTFWETVGSTMYPDAYLIGTKVWDAFIAGFMAVQNGVTASAIDQPWIVNADGTFGTSRGGVMGNKGLGAPLPIFVVPQSQTPTYNGPAEVNLTVDLTQYISGDPSNYSAWQAEVIQTIRDAVQQYTGTGAFAR